MKNLFWLRVFFNSTNSFVHVWMILPSHEFWKDLGNIGVKVNKPILHFWAASWNNISVIVMVKWHCKDRQHETSSTQNKERPKSILSFVFLLFVCFSLRLNIFIFMVHFIFIIVLSICILGVYVFYIWILVYSLVFISLSRLVLCCHRPLIPSLSPTTQSCHIH